ncbi:saccharopine dehydrogenase C-terminal domain-containing protein [Kangiella sp. TOML190]|uniref:saccharopine dehydrogenase C-terminal domain-containing protein n=1 Tax=Kangiella sp. TOML190 TaxID=2931351 RepID=UPI00203D30CD|nr:saccharopine dehydrogenase C-terminal domain-containing protein [Kangiella sp. TOML190]
MSNILVLGAGFVAEPLVEYLNRRDDNRISVASYVINEAQALADKFPKIDALQVDVSDQEALECLLVDYDLVVSLVPAPFHPTVAKAAIAQKVAMVTASYESDEMRDLATEAEEAGVIILNEIGLDPGIDHLSAMEVIDQVQQKGEKITAFVSWCGGVPAPESNNNPIGYKFSWAPKGVLMALLNKAQYLHQNQAVTVSSDQLMDWAKPLLIEGLQLEGYPNRESISYKEVYGIDSAESLLRGTLRYQGFSEIIKGAYQLNLLSTKVSDVSATGSWKDYIVSLNQADNLEQLLKVLTPKAKDALTWLGCFSELQVAAKNSPIDVFCALLIDKLQYLEGESDMIALQHKFVVEDSAGGEYFLSSTLIAVGDPDGYSAMSKTVGYPAAIASQLILDNKVERQGVLRPVFADIYQPTLKALAAEGIECVEKRISSSEMSKQEFLAELYS